MPSSSELLPSDSADWRFAPGTHSKNLLKKEVNFVHYQLISCLSELCLAFLVPPIWQILPIGSISLRLSVLSETQRFKISPMEEGHCAITQKNS